MKQITKEHFIKAQHPNENKRFTLALVICIPVLITAVVLSVVTAGGLLLLIALTVFLFWFGLRIAQASMVANAIRVSKINFPEINLICEEIKVAMGYRKEIRIFIIDEGGFNAFLAKFFRVKFIMLTTSLAEDMSLEENAVQLKWIIARFIGSLQAKQIRLDFLKILIESIDSIKIFSLFILPYERALQYTGDNIGLLYCEDIDQVLKAFNKFLVGSKLSDKVHFEGVLEQSSELQNTLFSLLARIGSSHPHTVYRYLNLLAFARKEFPEQFEKYISSFDKQTTLNIGRMLPNVY